MSGNPDAIKWALTLLKRRWSRRITGEDGAGDAIRVEVVVSIVAGTGEPVFFRPRALREVATNMRRVAPELAASADVLVRYASIAEATVITKGGMR